MIVVEAILITAALLVAAPVALFFLQVVAALPARHEAATASGRRPRIAVLVPAHNEGAGVAPVVKALLPQLRDDDRVLVVADNCSDDTACIAAEAGAEVVERCDAERRGKGYALDFGVRHLERAPPEVVVIVDADCLVETGALDRLARRCGETGRPVQALYLMRSPTGAGLKTRIAEFAWTVKNHARALGYLRLGLPCQLMGTGMAFPWVAMRDAELATGHIVEDLKLGLDLARAGTPALFCPDAVVTSVFPSSAEGVQSQRTRWEHGHIGVILGEGPKLLARALGSGNRALAALVFDLFVPPLALLTLLVLAVSVLAVTFWFVGGGSAPALLAMAVLGLLVAAVLMAWLRFGRHILSLGDLLRAPLYALWKIPMYVRYVLGRQVEWVRSKRDES